MLKLKSSLLYVNCVYVRSYLAGGTILAMQHYIMYKRKHISLC